MLFLCHSSLFGQVKKYTVVGQIVDEERHNLIGATVVLLNTSDSIMLGFGSSDLEGKYKVNNVKAGEIIVQVTYLGYGTFEKKVEISGDAKMVDLGVTTLYTDAHLMDAIDIKAEYIPIVVKKDTVEYNADAFKVRPNANVEELLKKLPGVEVETDGSITAQGEQVKTITVDGKKFFGDDPKMASQNLPADAVKKVQIIDKKSDKAEFSGISDGQTEKTINLELKDDKKIGLFGDVKAGYGTDNRFDTKFSLNKFGSKYQFATLIGYNNINQQGFSFNDYNTLVGGIKGNRSGGINFSGPINFGDNTNGNTTSLNGGINFSYDIAKKSKITTSYYLSYVDKFASEITKAEYFLPERNYLKNTESTSTNNSLGHNISLDLDLAPDSLYRLDFSAAYKLNNSDQVSSQLQKSLSIIQELINDSDQKDNGQLDKKDASFSLELNRKLNKPGRLFTLKGSYGQTDTNDDSSLSRYANVYEGDSTFIENLFQDQLSYLDNKNYNASINYSEPLGNKNYLNFNYTKSNYNYQNTKDFFDFDPNNISVREFNQLLSDLTKNNINYNKIGAGYTSDREKYNLNVDLYYQISTLKSASQKLQDIDKDFKYLLPSLSLSLPLQNIRFNYRTSVSEPSSSQLQSIVDNSDPTNIYIGNPNLKPKYSHNFNLRYNLFDNFNFRNIFAYLSYTYTKDDIVTSKITDRNLITTSTSLNVSNNQSLYGSLNFGTPIKPLHIKTRLSVNNNYRKSIAFINGSQNYVNSNSPSFRLEFENLDNETISLLVNGRMRYSQNKYSANSERNTSYFTQDYGAVLLVNLGKGFSFDSDLSYTIYSKEQFGDNNKIALLNAGLSRTFFNDRLTAKIYTFDILNQNQGIERQLSDTSISEAISNTLSQYTMLTFTYKLSAFSPKSPDIMIMRR